MCSKPGGNQMMGKEVKKQTLVMDRLLVLSSGVEWVGIARVS